MAEKKTVKIIAAILLLAVAIVSMFVVSKIVSSPEFTAPTLDALDEKKATVLKLTAASTAISTAVTVLPGDTASPIAEEIADLGAYFLIIVSAIYLEKFLVTITGAAAFKLLIPAGCLIGIAGIFSRNLTVKKVAGKLILFALAIVLVIPASVKVSELIDRTYGESINATLESALQTSDELVDTDKDEKSTTGLEKLIDNVKLGAGALSEKISDVINGFVESVAVMIVTSCLIPILVLVFFLWLTKILLGVNLDPPMRKHHRKPENEERTNA